ncbi:MAG: threonine--tRNA ligase [Spirochaetaceae bacterium]|nr:MAG: threonine--tRNA ligase [Spirochaetaceae bacterium]
MPGRRTGGRNGRSDMEREQDDHAAIGKRLELFFNDSTVGAGLPLLTPRGTVLKRVLTRFIEDEEIKRGYLPTDTPVLARSELFKISGHWDLYRDNMFVLESETEEKLALRPMTCPFQFMIYKQRVRSYRELPLRYSETATLFRNESSGALHGLLRLRQFTLSDGHVICTEDQIESEFLAAFELVRYVFDTLGLDGYWFRFSRRGKSGKYIDDPNAWELSEAALARILDSAGIEYVEADDEAAFYGPKLDVQMRNVWGKEDTIFTLQLDFALARRFEMTYVSEDGSLVHPFVIHRSSIGCYERTIAMLLEQYKGKLPFWIAPEQVRVASVGDSSAEYANAVAEELRQRGIRAEADVRSETVGRKIREARLMYIPVLAIVGDAERSAGTVAIRTADGDQIADVPRNAFLEACSMLEGSRSKRTNADFFRPATARV